MEQIEIDGSYWSGSRSSHLSPEESLWYPLARWLRGTQSRSGSSGGRKIYVPPGNRNPAVQPLVKHFIDRFMLGVNGGRSEALGKHK
jgi:hypothetical protein